jgi:pimeloyl-ACP methyl ester carboxylesterase
VRGEFVDVGGVRLYYYAAGTRGAGEPVLLLHGFPASSYLWSDVVPRLPAGHRVIVPDLLGFGRSEPPQPGQLDNDLTISGHARRGAQLLDVLNVGQACIVGHGFGAAVALDIAVRHPHRVTRVCLINAVTPASWPSRDAMMAHAVSVLAPVLPQGLPLWFARRALRRGFADSALAAHSADHYLRVFRAPGGRAVLRAHLRALTRAAFPSLPVRTPQSPGWAAPTAIIWGDRDRLLPIAAGHALHAYIPNATLDIVSGGHYAPEESPAQVATIIARLLSS